LFQNVNFENNLDEDIGYQCEKNDDGESGDVTDLFHVDASEKKE